MGREDSFSLTDRWFVDGDAPMADDELTREIRDIDMLPANRFDRKQLDEGLAYRAVVLRGARVLPTDPPESYAEEDVTDAFDVEDPFETSSLPLPQNLAGDLHGHLARWIERALERWERVRLRLHAWQRIAQRRLPAGAARAPGWRLAASVVAALAIVGLAIGASTLALAVGSTVQAEAAERVADEDAAVQQRALQKLAVQWALSQGGAEGAPDMAFTGEDLRQLEAGDPEPEVSLRPRRRVERRERAESRRERRHRHKGRRP